VALVIGIKQKREVMLGCNKNYAKLALNCILKNSKETILASRIKKRCRNNNIRTHKPLKRALINVKG